MAESTKVGVRALRENLSRYIAEARGGASVTIVSRGKPVAELHPPTQTKRPMPRVGGLKGKIWMADNWDEWSEEELAAFEAPINPYERGDGDA